jgi:hypothetical protein
VTNARAGCRAASASTSPRHENAAGLPASTSSTVAALRASSLAISGSFTWPVSSGWPSSVDSVVARPVRLGFFASSLTSGRARELRRRVRHFLRRQEQAVCSKNGPPPGSATWPMRPASDCFCSAPVSARGGRRELGRGRLDDREDRAVTLRERVVDRLTQRGPLRLGIDELADVRVDLEVLCHVHAAACGNDERQHDDQDGAAYRPCNESDDERCHHLAVGSGWQGQSNESIWRNVRSVVTMARKGREGYLLRIAGIGPAHRQLVSVCLIIGTPRRAMQRL